jgi:ribulose-phosphate 3-epimerase
MKAGVAINPHTPVNFLTDVINNIDVVCLMSVNPGFGGQKFIEHSYQKMMDLNEMINTKKAGTLIEIDGGVDLNNYKKLVEKGANVLVAGNAVFSSETPVQTIAMLKTS